MHILERMLNEINDITQYYAISNIYFDYLDQAIVFGLNTQPMYKLTRTENYYIISSTGSDDDEAEESRYFEIQSALGEALTEALTDVFANVPIKESTTDLKGYLDLEVFFDTFIHHEVEIIEHPEDMFQVSLIKDINVMFDAAVDTWLAVIQDEDGSLAKQALNEGLLEPDDLA